ncbi:MAG: B12-binding domain-containing radical SAM protein [Planctomycetota bacterium]|jgi:radical SAM superfamily enzyme YgiQ (UPF0313 family)
MVPEKVVVEDGVDFVCVGEGEEALLELVETLERGGDPSGIRNIWSRSGAKLHRNPVRPLPDLSTLPMHDHDLFEFDALTKTKGGWVGLLSSRGCPYRCTYCFNHRMEERYRKELGVSAKALGYVRRYPPERVVEEIRALLGRSAEIRMFIFDDDLFTHDPEYVKTFCRLYREVSDVPLTVNAHVRRFDDEVAAALRDARCRIVKFGVESGSPRIRSEVMNRHMTNERIREAVDSAHRAGLVTSAFVMIGLPRETPDDLDRTFDLMAIARPGRMRWSTFYPFPGTRAYEMVREDGSLDQACQASLDGFFEASCLDLGEVMNRRVHRARWLFPWHVNARLPDPVGKRYAALVRDFEAMDDGEFTRSVADFRTVDGEIGEAAAAAGGDPYRIRYNDFMAVRSGTGAEDDPI